MMSRGNLTKVTATAIFGSTFVCALIFSTTAQALTADQFMQTAKILQDSSNTQIDNLNEISSRDGDRRSKEVVRSYYKNVVIGQYLNPRIKNWQSQVGAAVSSYAGFIKSQIEKTEGMLKTVNPNDDTNQSDKTDYAERFEKCLSNKEISAAQWTKQGSALTGYIASVGGTYRRYGSDDGAAVSTALKAFNDNVSGSFKVCCMAQPFAADAQGDGSKKSALCEEAASGIEAQRTALMKSLDEATSAAYVGELPDPLRDTTFSVNELAEIISGQRRWLTSTRDVNDPAAEAGAFQALETQCEVRRLQKQSKATGLSAVMGTMGVKLAQFAKCDLAPFLGSQYGTLGVHAITTGIAGADLKWGDQENQNLNCDPKQTAMWAQTRSFDPVKTDEFWGLPQIGNPPYLMSMRNLPAVQTPTTFALSDGGLFTPWGSVGQPLTTVANANPSGISPLVGLRGVNQGRALARGIRAVSAKITSGDAPLKNAQILKSGSANTRAFAQKIAANNRALSSTARLARRSTSARSAQRQTLAVVRAAASRTSARDQLNALQRGRAANSVPNPPVASLDTVMAQNEADRARAAALAEQVNARIQAAAAKAEEFRQLIFKTLAERDAVYQAKRKELFDQPLAKQAKIVTALRKEALNYDKLLGQYKAQFDLYQNQVSLQSMSLQSLTAFGAPKTTPSTGGGRISLFEKISEFLDPFKNAWAVAGKFEVFQKEMEWRQRWDKYNHDVEVTAQAQEREYKTVVQQALAVYRQHQASLTAENVSDEDTETLVMIEMFAESVKDESSDLIEHYRLSRDMASVDGNLLPMLRSALGDSLATQESLEQIALQYKDSFPKSYEDNPEVWWAQLPQTLVP